MTTQKQPMHDIVVIAASSGGLEALSALTAALPADLGATVFVVMHLQPGFDSRLPELLNRNSPLKSTFALHGETITPGRIYIAPADNHLQLRDGYVQVVRGPKENGHRPAADALFRTASTAYGPRVIGVVLTGYRDCGTAGLLSIKARGGIAVVQSPETAAVPEMPRSAIAHVAVDHVVPLSEIPDLIVRLVKEPAIPLQTPIPQLAVIEGEERGDPVEIACPLCLGHMTEAKVGDFSYFRCHVGHAFSLASMAAEQAEELERALWAAVRALQESASMAERLGDAAPASLRERMAEKAQAQNQQAETIRDILLGRSRLANRDADVVTRADAETAAENH
jgi:two-component system chemotaxis response regulator CheB